MRKLKQIFGSIVALVLAATAAVPAFAQAYPQKVYFAADYGTWQIKGQTANSFTFQPGTLCQVPAPNTGSFYPFNTNASVYVQDSTAASSELLTPSATTNTNALCSVTVTALNNHYSFNLMSGTGGLQETLNQISSGNVYAAVVYLDRNWYQAVNSIPGQTAAKAISTATGNAAATLVDNTTAPWTFYSWNGTNYTVSASNQTVPTVAANTGAGTSPTIAIVGTGTSGNVTLTTGTTPAASGIIFTLTWPSIALGGFQYAPACTFTSVGTRVYTSGVTTTTAGPPATAVLTASSTALTASVSGYKFSYVCH
jgi:hypothetical protein